MINRRTFIGSLLASGLAGSFPNDPSRELLANSEHHQRLPNVILIITDDQEYGDLACFGGQSLTPRIDHLCSEGVRLTNFFVSSPLCTPSRYSFLTGNYAARNTSPLFHSYNPGQGQTYVHWNTALEKNSNHIAKILKKAGYKTGFVGKWHLGSDEQSIEGGFIANNKRFANIPKALGKQKPRFEDADVQKMLARNYQKMVELVKEQGFDFVEGLYWDNPEAFEIDGLDHNLEWLTQYAVLFIKENSHKPFFLTFCPTTPHGPWNDLRKIDPLATPSGRLEKQPSIMPSRESIYERLKDAGLSPNNHILAHNLWLDDSIGVILDTLKNHNLYNDTLILYASDNARLEKGFLYRNGVQVPAFLWYKKMQKNKSDCSELIANVDFMPTVLEACGVNLNIIHIDGKSLWPFLTGKTNLHREHLFLDVGATRAVVTKKWKYIAFRYPDDIDQRIQKKRVFNKGHGGFLFLEEGVIQKHPSYWQQDQLYNIVDDPDEKNNLALHPDYQSILKEMKNLMNRYILSLGRPFGEFGRSSSI